MKRKMIATIFIVLLMLLFSFFLTAGLVKLACWAFSYTFTWKLAIGIWAVLWLLGSVFKSK